MIFLFIYYFFHFQFFLLVCFKFQIVLEENFSSEKFSFFFKIPVDPPRRVGSKPRTPWSNANVNLWAKDQVQGTSVASCSASCSRGKDAKLDCGTVSNDTRSIAGSLLLYGLVTKPPILHRRMAKDNERILLHARNNINDTLTFFHLTFSIFVREKENFCLIKTNQLSLRG